MSEVIVTRVTKNRFSQIDYLEYSSEDAPVCPHCKEQSIEWLFDHPIDEGDIEEMTTCAYCDKQFYVSRHIQVSFNTITKKDEKRLRKWNANN